MKPLLCCLNIARAELGEPVRRTDSEWLFHCKKPNHVNGDVHPSLAVNVSKNVWLCGPCGESGTPWQLAAFLAGLNPDDKPGVSTWLRERGLLNSEAENGPGPRIATTYDYFDEHGVLVYQVVRDEPKNFKQRRPDGNGGWVWNLTGVRRILYRLPDVPKAKSVLVVEGEKDADTGTALGLKATCNAGGAGKWRAEYSESLRDKQVVIIADADEPGRKHAQEVATSLYRKAEWVKVLELPGAKDLTEWVERGGTREDLLTIIRSTPEWILKQSKKDGFNLTRLGDLLNEPEEKVSWLVADKLPVGGISVLSAKPKVGKSTLARCLALAVSRGEPFLGCTTKKSVLRCVAISRT